MWPIFVEFRSATSEIGGRKKERRKKEEEEETLVKYKSADIVFRCLYTSVGFIYRYVYLSKYMYVT